MSDKTDFSIYFFSNKVKRLYELCKCKDKDDEILEQFLY